MSVKIERETTTLKEAVRDAVLDHTAAKGGLIGSAAAAISEAAHGELPGTKGKHPISAVVGTALTGGRQNAGTRGYLAVRLRRFFLQRNKHPRGMRPREGGGENGLVARA